MAAPTAVPAIAPVLRGWGANGSGAMEVADATAEVVEVEEVMGVKAAVEVKEVLVEAAGQIYPSGLVPAAEAEEHCDE